MLIKQLCTQFIVEVNECMGRFGRYMMMSYLKSNIDKIFRFQLVVCGTESNHKFEYVCQELVIPCSSLHVIFFDCAHFFGGCFISPGPQKHFSENVCLCICLSVCNVHLCVELPCVSRFPLTKYLLNATKIGEYGAQYHTQRYFCFSFLENRFLSLCLTYKYFKRIQFLFVFSNSISIRFKTNKSAKL